MGYVVRLLLILASLFTTLYILKRIRNAKLQIEYAIFWLLFAGILLVISIFPNLMIMLTRAIGMQSPINCGVFAMAAGLTIVPVVSLITPAPDKKLVEDAFSCYNK